MSLECPRYGPLRRFLVWVNKSLLGHIVFYEILVSVPALTWFFVENYSERTLTWTFTLQFVLLSLLLGAAAGFALWHTVTLPIKRRLERRE
jgi:hypothetical protein